MRVAVSSCLLGVCCKYSGGHNRSDELLELLEGHEVIPVCPEVLGGLPVPRPSCEIVNGTVRTQTGESKERPYQEGARRALAIVEERRAGHPAAAQPQLRAHAHLRRDLFRGADRGERTICTGLAAAKDPGGGYGKSDRNSTAVEKAVK